MALAITLVSIAVGLAVLVATGSLDSLVPGESDPSAAGIMVNLLSLATAELFILWGVFWLVKRSRAKSSRI